MVVVTSLGPPEEGVRMKQENTAVFINQKSLGMGALYISDARVSWVGITGQGFSLEYPHIALHAVSRDLTQFHSECLYLMIDVRLVDSDGTPMSTPTSSDAGSDDEGNDDDSDGGMTEVRFVPDDRASLDQLFAVMSECQALHPDPDDSGDSGQEEDGMFDDAEEGDDGMGPSGDTGQNGGGTEAMEAE